MRAAVSLPSERSNLPRQPLRGSHVLRCPPGVCRNVPALPLGPKQRPCCAHTAESHEYGLGQRGCDLSVARCGHAAPKAQLCVGMPVPECPLEQGKGAWQCLWHGAGSQTGPARLAHTPAECKHRPGRQLPGGGAAPAQVAGPSPGPTALGEPCSGPHSTCLALGRQPASPKSPPRPPAPSHGEHGGCRGPEEESGPAAAQAVHGGEEEDGARGGEQRGRGARRPAKESVRPERVQPETARYPGEPCWVLLAVLQAGSSLALGKGTALCAHSRTQHSPPFPPKFFKAHRACGTADETRSRPRAGFGRALHNGILLLLSSRTRLQVVV